MADATSLPRLESNARPQRSQFVRAALPSCSGHCTAALAQRESDLPARGARRGV